MPLKATFCKILQSISRLLATRVLARDCEVWSINNIPRAIPRYTRDLPATFFLCHVNFSSNMTKQTNCPIAYGRDTCSSYTRPKELSEIDSECWCKCWSFRSEHERDNLVPKVLSRGCVSECTAQELFCNYELCRCHIGQWVRDGAEEPIFVNAKWASDTFAHWTPSKKHWIPFGYLRVKKALTYLFRNSYRYLKRLKGRASASKPSSTC